MNAQVSILVYGLATIFFLIILDIVAGASAALSTTPSTFNYKEFWKFIRQSILPYGIVWIVVSGLPVILQYLKITMPLIPLDSIAAISWLAITGALVSSITDNFKKIGITVTPIVK